ncbi:MAG: hypothetical protein ACI9NC_003366, partial [Verrucomicrobiales bacterium]
MNRTILSAVGGVAIAATAFSIGRLSAPTDIAAPSDSSVLARRPALSSIVTADGSVGKVVVENGSEFLSKYFEGESGELSKQSMTAAMREALAESDPVKRSLMMAQLLQNLSADNVEAALAAMRESPDR